MFGGVLPEKLPVVPAAIAWITEDDLGVITVPAMVGLHLGLEIMAFVETIPSQVVDPGNAFAGKTYTQLGAKLHRLMLLPLLVSSALAGVLEAVCETVFSALVPLLPEEASSEC